MTKDKAASKVAYVVTTKTTQTETVWRLRLTRDLVLRIKKLAKSEGRSATKQAAKLLHEAMTQDKENGNGNSK